MLVMEMKAGIKSENVFSSLSPMVLVLLYASQLRVAFVLVIRK